MSPFVKSLINNNLVSVRDKIQGNILSLEDSKAENVIPRIPTPQFQSNVIGTLMRSQSNLSFSFQNDIKENTDRFNKMFVAANTRLTFVAQMRTTIKKSWTEKKTELMYNQTNIHILIADDSLSLIQSIKATLSKTNVIIDTASDGNEAYEEVLKMMKKGKVYHLILMDVHMPSCDGYNATKNIRKLEALEKVNNKNHIVAISADENDLTVSLYHEGGMNDFI